MLYFYIHEVCKFRTGKGGTLKVEAESRARGYVAAGQGVTQMRRDGRTKGGEVAVLRAIPPHWLL